MKKDSFMESTNRKTGTRQGRSTTLLIFSLLLATLWAGCKKEVIEKTVYDNTVYGITPQTLYGSNAEKTKQKSAEQFISILYTNFTNQTIPSDELANLGEVSYSFGDKGLMNTMFLENFLNDPALEVPTGQQMRSDVDSFVVATYLKFYLRQPSEYEKYYFTNLIEGDTTITPTMVYAAFAQSNEYLFY